MTHDEARMRAASIAMEAVCGIRTAELPHEVRHELDLVVRWLRDRACGGDKILRRQLGRELGRQVRPPAAQRPALEGLARQRKGRDGQE